GHVDGIGRAVDLGQDVAHAGRFEDGPDGAARDHAGALGGRLEQHAAGPIDDLDLVRDGRPDHGDLDEVLLCVLDALADRLRDLARLADPDPDVARAVTGADGRAGAQPPAALADLGDSIDLADPLLGREPG